jgi:hypothetical protein
MDTSAALPPLWFRFFTKLNFRTPDEASAVKLWDEISEGDRVLQAELERDKSQRDMFWKALRVAETNGAKVMSPAPGILSMLF